MRESISVAAVGIQRNESEGFLGADFSCSVGGQSLRVLARRDDSSPFENVPDLVGVPRLVVTPDAELLSAIDNQLSRTDAALPSIERAEVLEKLECELSDALDAAVKEAKASPASPMPVVFVAGA